MQTIEPKKKRRSLKRDVRQFMAHLLLAERNNEGIWVAMGELGWTDSEKVTAAIDELYWKLTCDKD